jgi:uncharacterized protein (TIGR04255 family)
MAFQYQKAPITEALIDIRVELPASVSLQRLEDLHNSVEAKYPRKKGRVQVQGQFSVGNQLGASATQTQTGFLFETEDGKQIIQARVDGFTFSRLKPYGNWADLRDEARRLWQIYREAVNPVSIVRVAVRYINQIDIPSQSVDYKHYFRTTPEVSPVLPQALSSFFMQLQFPQIDFGGALILTQAALPAVNPQVASVILDLDVFKEQTKLVSDDDVWELLETLRNRKNEFFEGCITDRTRELFGERTEY